MPTQLSLLNRSAHNGLNDNVYLWSEYFPEMLMELSVLQIIWRKTFDIFQKVLKIIGLES